MSENTLLKPMVMAGTVVALDKFVMKTQNLNENGNCFPSIKHDKSFLSNNFRKGSETVKNIFGSKLPSTEQTKQRKTLKLNSSLCWVKFF